MTWRGIRSIDNTFGVSSADLHTLVGQAFDIDQFFATTVDRRIAEGEFVADGPAATVLTASPAFAPQVAKILAPARYLTTDQLTDMLAGDET